MRTSSSCVESAPLSASISTNSIPSGQSKFLPPSSGEVAAHESGALYLILHGLVLELFNSSGATAMHLSLSHTTEHAIAQVVLERIG